MTAEAERTNKNYCPPDLTVPHKWDLQSPNGSAYVEGTCDFCDATREFPASFEELMKVSKDSQNLGTLSKGKKRRSQPELLEVDNAPDYLELPKGVAVPDSGLDEY